MSRRSELSYLILLFRMMSFLMIKRELENFVILLMFCFNAFYFYTLVYFPEIQILAKLAFQLEVD